MNQFGFTALALLLSIAVSVKSAAQGPPVKVDPWVPTVGARAATEHDALVVRSGAVRTNRLYSDFVFMFEFQLMEARSEGSVLVRSRFGYGNSPTTVYGYRVALTGQADAKIPMGRVTRAEFHMKEVGFEPVRTLPLPGEWQECEIRAERDTLTVKINGALVSTIRDLDEFTGYFGVESTSTQGIGFRNFRAIRLPHAHDPFGADAHLPNERGVVLPQRLEDAKPFYPREAFDARIEGKVGLQAVVQANGAVGDIRVVRPLEPDLDEAAIASARKWRFKPGTKDGQSVAVVVWLEISFKVSGGPR